MRFGHFHFDPVKDLLGEGPLSEVYLDAWLARYDGAGNQTWIRQLGTGPLTNDYATCATADGAGGVYTSGFTGGSLAGPQLGGGDVWLAHYDSAGNQTWKRQTGTAAYDAPSASSSDGAGGLFVCGSTQGSFGGPSAGQDDAWFGRYDSAGNQLWKRQLGTSGSDIAAVAVTNGSGSLYVGGRTGGNLGGTSVGFDDVWLARYDAPCSLPAPYCTAKVNSQGCLPTISSTGVPSASAGSGFVVAAGQVLNNKNGLLFYGTSGQAALAYQAGTLCVKSPIKRTPAGNSGGNPPPNDCSGLFAIDMNLFAVGGLGGTPLAALTVPGTIVNCQWWGRDPGFVAPNNTTLSDGLEYTVCP